MTLGKLGLAAILLAAPLTGCLGLFGPLAPMPGQGAPFTAHAWACGLLPYPQAEVAVVYPNGTLVELRVEQATDPANQTAQNRLGQAFVQQVVVAADATGALNLTRITGGEHGWLVTKAGAIELGWASMRELRARVHTADLETLAARYDETDIVDGCSHTYAAWEGTRWATVTFLDDAGPERLDQLIAYEDGLLAR